MYESDADRLESLRAVGAETVEFDGGKFDGVFDLAYIEIDAMDTSVDSRQPLLVARTSDVERIPKGAILSLRGNKRFRIVRHEPDGVGISRLILAEA